MSTHMFLWKNKNIKWIPLSSKAMVFIFLDKNIPCEMLLMRCHIVCVCGEINESHLKMFFHTCAPSKDSDQPANLHIRG